MARRTAVPAIVLAFLISLFAVACQADGAALKLALAVTPTGAIAGVVSDSATRLPIGGAAMSCGSLTATTDARGRYGFSDLGIGSYTVAASAPDHTPSSASTVAVVEGEISTVDFSLSPTAFGSIVGRVTDGASGLPIQWAHVTCGALSATTSVDGSYTLANVPVGTGYRVGAAAGGHKWGSATGVAVVSGQTATQDFSLAQLPVKAGPQFEQVTGLNLPNSVGVGWGDYDSGGYPDLFFGGYDQGTSHPQHGPMLFRNGHDLTFADVSQTLKLPTAPAPDSGVAWGDYNNDGLLDVLVGGDAYPWLFRRDPSQFVELGADAGLHVAFNAGSSVSWCDFNGDGLLDAFVCNIFGNAYLLRNNGDGTFTDIAAAAGLGGADAVQSAAWGDYDNDGHPDLLLARMYKPAMLFHNNGDGTYTDVSAQAGVTIPVNTLSAIWGDYDNDGWLDCYFTSGESAPDWLFHNDHNGTFTDVANVAGMAGDAYNAQGAAWADYDNDGYLDLFVGNFGQQPFLYHNNGNGTFTNMVAGSGLDVDHQGASGGVAWADVNLDGRVDVVQALYDTPSWLFHNIGTSDNWLRLRAITSAAGDTTDTSKPTRDAIGARVELNVDNDASFPPGHTLTRLIDGGSGFCAESEQVAQFGIPTDGPVAVRVRFPDGTVVIHYDIAVNQTIVVKDVAAALAEDKFTDAGYQFWAFGAIEAVSNASIALGYPDGTYHPEVAVTRDQMAVYISRALAGGDANVPTGPATASFPDDVPTDFWAYKYVEYAVAQGVVQGYDATHYEPTLVVDRGQMAVFIARAKGWVKLSDALNTAPQLFPDVPAGYWSGVAIKACVDHDVVKGYDNGTYQPTNPVTRDQMAVYIARAFELPV